MKILNKFQKVDFQKIQRNSKKLFGIKSQKAKPHFLGIGTQKGGTTTLYQILKQHQDIYLPDNKEIHYFTKYYDLGKEWYIKNFEGAKPGQLRGEITPYYLFHEAVPKRIYSFKKNMKFIVLLRDPVERALSQYFHSVRLGLESLPLESALKAEEKRLSESCSIISIPGKTHKSHQEHSYISRSKYDIQIQRYLKLFNSKNFLIIKSEDLFSNSHSTLNRLSKFLGIEEFNNGIEIPKENPGAGESSKVSIDIKNKIMNELSETYKWIKEEIGISWSR